MVDVVASVFLSSSLLASRPRRFAKCHTHAVGPTLRDLDRQELQQHAVGQPWRRGDKYACSALHGSVVNDVDDSNLGALDYFPDA